MLNLQIFTIRNYLNYISEISQTNQLFWTKDFHLLQIDFIF